MFDPFAMFNGGMPNAEGMMVMEKVEHNDTLNSIIAFLQNHRYASTRDACKACRISYNTLSTADKKYIHTKAPWSVQRVSRLSDRLVQIKIARGCASAASFDFYKNL